MTQQERQRLLEETAIGGLLHDVGKVVQRGRSQNLSHMEFGGQWLESLGEPWARFAWAARHHHRDSRYRLTLKDLDNPRWALAAAAIAEGDSLSASEREDLTGTDWDPNAPLRNVFDEIRLDSSAPRSSSATFFDLAELNEGLPLPAAKPQALLGPAYEKITENLRVLLADTGQAESTFLLRALERYTSFIPSDTARSKDRHPDISLFDHLRTTAMLAVCLVDATAANHPELLAERRADTIATALSRLYGKAEGDKAPFLLVGGDLRGVQHFIYDIATQRALKLLRTRSFYLEIAQEHLVAQLLQDLGLPRTQVLYIGGGHFTLLLPNTEAIRDHLAAFAGASNEKLLAEGTLSLSLGWTPLTWQELKNRDVRQAYRRLAGRMTLKKVRPLEGLLKKTLGPDSRTGHASCPICGTRTERLIDDLDGLCCRRCRDFARLGSRLAGEESRYAYPVPEGRNGDFTVLGQPYALAAEQKGIPDGTPWVFVLRKTRHLPRGENGRFIALPAEIYSYDREIEKVLDDGCIGARRLAALRLDVDNLGRIFHEGLPDSPEEGKRYSLSRLATLSRMMTLFFKEAVAQVASAPMTRLLPGLTGKRKLIVVYAGGDDLFALGAWNEAAEFAIDITRTFRAFTGGNPDVTLSGGLVLLDDKTPVYQAAQLAGKAEDHAKNHRFGGRTKDSLAFFYTPSFGDGEAREEDFAFNVREELPTLERWVLGLVEGAKTDASDGRRHITVKTDRAFLRRLFALRLQQRRGDALWKIQGAYAAGRSNSRQERQALSGLLDKADELRAARIAVEWVDLALRRSTGRDG